MSVLRRLVRYHRHLLDEKRRALRALEERSASIETSIETLDRTVVSEQQAARAFEEGPGVYGEFARASLERRVTLLEALSEANREVEEARSDLLDMFGEMKRYEIGLQHQEAEERLAADRRAQDAVDEAALNQYRRPGRRP